MAERSFQFFTLLGSLRRGGLHATLAHALSGLAPDGVTISSLPSIQNFPPYDADLQATGFPAIVLSMAESIRAADAVIIITPEYNYSVPGVLKNALDWLSRLDPQPFAGKLVAIQTGSPGMVGGSRAQYHLRQILVYLDANVINKPEVMIGFMHEKIDVARRQITNSDTARCVEQQLIKLANTLRAERY